MRRRERGVHRSAQIGRGVVFDVTPGAELTIDKGAMVGDGCRFHVRAGAVRIGAGARLGARCVVLAHAGVDIGAGAILGDDVVLVDFAHGHADAETPVRHQPLDCAPIEVGDNARVGHRVVVERGARIPAGADVPAQTVRR